jgi:hypothetical protein
MVMKQDGIMERNEDGKMTVFKKRPLLAYLRIAFPNIKPSAINRQLNNLFKDDVLKIWDKYKTKPYVIKSRQYESRMRQATSRVQRSKTDMLFEILMGDDPSKRMRYITDCIANGDTPELDV